MNVTQDALIKRINRKLRHSNLALVKNRGQGCIRGARYGGYHDTPYGSFYMIERSTYSILLVTQDLETLARMLGVMGENETLYSLEKSSAA